jgi:homoserine kinase type II
MSVYTRLTKEELEQLLSHYEIGNFVDIDGISEGITNSNYYLTTSKNKYILTIFEEPKLNLNYAIELMDILAGMKIPCPTPVRTKKGDQVIHLFGKPISIFTLLPGKTITNISPSVNMCEQIGETLAKLHIYSKEHKRYDLGLRDNSWFTKTAEKLNPVLNMDDINLISNEILNQQDCVNKNLPEGVIHSDLFRDNAMFIGEELTGVIDFYYACNGYYLYDLAIITNDWCLKDNRKIDFVKQDALMKSYNKIREIEPIEKLMWPKVLRHAALRFWLSRLHDKHYPTDGEMTHVLDPNEFKLILIDRINNSYKLNL